VSQESFVETLCSFLLLKFVCFKPHSLHFIQPFEIYWQVSKEFIEIRVASKELKHIEEIKRQARSLAACGSS